MYAPAPPVGGGYPPPYFSQQSQFQHTPENLPPRVYRPPSESPEFPEGTTFDGNTFHFPSSSSSSSSSSKYNKKLKIKTPFSCTSFCGANSLGPNTKICVVDTEVKNTPAATHCHFWTTLIFARLYPQSGENQIIRTLSYIFIPEKSGSSDFVKIKIIPQAERTLEKSGLSGRRVFKIENNEIEPVEKLHASESLTDRELSEKLVNYVCKDFFGFKKICNEEKTPLITAAKNTGLEYDLFNQYLAKNNRSALDGPCSLFDITTLEVLTREKLPRLEADKVHHPEHDCLAGLSFFTSKVKKIIGILECYPKLLEENKKLQHDLSQKDLRLEALDTCIKEQLGKIKKLQEKNKRLKALYEKSVTVQTPN